MVLIVVIRRKALLSQRPLLCLVLNNTKLTDTEIRLVVARGQGLGVGKIGEEDQEVKASSYKISPGDIMHSMVTVENSIVLQI